MLEKTFSSKVKSLMIFNAKGGVGKTAIALNLALTHGYKIITNDRLSAVEQVLPQEKYTILSKNQSILEVVDESPTIFDFGGYPDKRASVALKMSQFVLIPILPYTENLQTSLDFIKEVCRYKAPRQIVLIMNQTTGNQCQEFSSVFRHFYQEMPIFNIKKSAVFAWMMERKLSIEELVLKYKFHARHFNQVADQFTRITEHLLGKNDLNRCHNCGERLFAPAGTCQVCTFCGESSGCG